MRSPKLFFVLAIFGLGLFLNSGSAIAQTEAAQDAAQEVNLDEDIQPQDLGVSEPRILPGSPFYFIKDLSRSIQDILTFNRVSKAELKLKFASERLVEAKKLAETTKDPVVIEKGVVRYQLEIEKIKSAADSIKTTAVENPKVDKFLDKFVRQQILHQRLLQKLESQVPSGAFAQIKDARLKHLESFGQVMEKLDDKTKIAERLDKGLKEIKGSQFQEFKNLEVLKELKEKAPEAIREAITETQESSFGRLKSGLEAMSQTEQEKFSSYIEKSSGAKEKHLEIIEDLRSEIKSAPETPKIKELRKILETGRIEAIKGMIRPSPGNTEEPCPIIPVSIPQNCQGRTIIEKNSAGCIIAAKCLAISPLPKTPLREAVPGGPETSGRKTPSVPSQKICVALWDPVCGNNGKTYSNRCFAKEAGVEIKYKGICPSSSSEQKIQSDN